MAPAAPLSESPASGAPVPLLELEPWRRRFGVAAGITVPGDVPEPGFDLGLWTSRPVGEVMDRWRAFRRGIPGFGATVLAHQVHGARVLWHQAAAGWVQLEGADGHVTATPGILLTVTVADCIPVYLVVPGPGGRARAVGLLHSGWRGTAAGILEQGVALLCSATGAAPADLVMHCGAGICGDCYEVGSEVVEGCGGRAEGPGPWRIDLRSVLTAQGEALGIGEITRSGWCTAHDRPRFYSHRASGGRDGRMVAYLGIPADVDGTGGGG